MSTPYEEDDAYFVDSQGYLRTKHMGTWTDHEHFDMRSNIMTAYGCTDTMLDMLRYSGGHIEFTNDRPAAPPRKWWRFWA